MFSAYRWATATDAGRTRDHNEDFVSPLGDGESRGPLVIAVADGVGGLQAGEKASRRAAEAATAQPPGARISVIDRALTADRAVTDFVLASDDVVDSATTLTVASFSSDGHLDVGHVGDSRLYIFSGTELVQVTTDQTVAQRKVDDGVITRAEAQRDPARHILTSACGLLDIKVQHIPGLVLRSGDRVLVCSDGLTEMLLDHEISGVLATQPEPVAAATALVDAANNAGGVDNITVAIVDIV